MQQGGLTIPGPSTARQDIMSNVQRVLREDDVNPKTDKSTRLTESFRNNYRQFLEMNPDSFSITKAVYLSESAFYDTPPSTYEQFKEAITKRAELVKQILKNEDLNVKNNVAANYGIEKLYMQSNVYHDSTTDKDYLVAKTQYDFDDFMGDKDWTKMFVTKLLHTGSGQCHSLPLLHLCIAEQLHAKSYLSLAPNHSFIQYFDDKGNRFNFETTNGNLVTQTWLAQSNYVNAVALKNKTYLDTLSSRKLYAQCLSDLLLSYLTKVGYYDNISNQITRKILEIDSNNIVALMTEANKYTEIFLIYLKKAGNPSPDKYPSFPALYAAYSAKEVARQKVEETGFQQMPKEEYQAWLKSLDAEKQKQQNQRERERMEYEIKKLKNIKSTLIDNPKE